MALLATPLLRALSEPRGADHYLALVAPTWSTTEIRARVIQVQRETADTVSLVLAPNANWRGFRAGQHVQLSVVIDGVRHTRTFSISSSPLQSKRIRITIRAFAGGLVSNWAAQHARPGDIVVLSAARGELVLPERVTSDLLFVSGGSGITPVLSILRALLEGGYTGKVTCMHYAREEIILHAELDDLAQQFPNFNFVPCMRPTGGSRFSRAAVTAAHPSWQHSETYVCGPASLEHAVREIWSAHALSDRLHVERFRQLPPKLVNASASTSCQLAFEKSGVSVRGNATRNLLEQAEAAGLRPAYGCRMGICHTCKCTKRSGIVHNAITGQLSSDQPESIRLCISTPMSDVTLDL